MTSSLIANIIIPHTFTHLAEIYGEGTYGSGSYSPSTTTTSPPPSSSATAAPNEPSSTSTQPVPAVEESIPTNDHQAVPLVADAPKPSNATMTQTATQNTPPPTTLDMNLVTPISAIILVIAVVVAIIIARK